MAAFRPPPAQAQQGLPAAGAQMRRPNNGPGGEGAIRVGGRRGNAHLLGALPSGGTTRRPSLRAGQGSVSGWNNAKIRGLAFADPLVSSLNEKSLRQKPQMGRCAGDLPLLPRPCLSVVKVSPPENAALCTRGLFFWFKRRPSSQSGLASFPKSHDDVLHSGPGCSRQGFPLVEAIRQDRKQRSPSRSTSQPAGLY